jgi:hypothetical protein
MKKKSTLIVAAALVVLAIALAILAALNGKTASAKKQLQEEKVFLVQSGEQKYRVTEGDILSLHPKEFSANYKKNGKSAQTRTFTGVPLAAVLRLKEIDLEGITMAAFAASDGYASALPIADALNEKSCFIVLDKEKGPFLMVMAKDQFSQRWCNFLTDVTLQ